MDDDYEGVYRSYYRKGATDGLPIVPPTDRRVDEMLEGTDRSFSTELTRLGDREGVLTVEKLAVNAMMAGCLPVHMPVPVAGVKDLGEPESAIIEAAIGTDSSGHFYLINGPLRLDLDVNFGTGTFGPGFRSDRTIGRALGLVLKNTTKLHAGEQVMGVLGNPFKNSMVAAEHEENSPWDPFHVERGYDRSESTITLMNVNWYVQTYPEKRDIKAVLSDLVYNTPPQMGFKSGGIYVISPATAKDLESYSKDAIREYIYDNTVVPEEELIKVSKHTFEPGRGVSEPHEDELPPTMSRVYNRMEEFHVIVAGGPGKWNGILGSIEGGPVTKRVETPGAWDELLDKY